MKASKELVVNDILIELASMGATTEQISKAEVEHWVGTEVMPSKDEEELVEEAKEEEPAAVEKDNGLLIGVGVGVGILAAAGAGAGAYLLYQRQKKLRELRKEQLLHSWVVMEEAPEPLPQRIPPFAARGSYSDFFESDLLK